MSAWLEGIIEQYGFAAVALGTALEGDAAALAGGMLAYRGLLPLWPAAGAAMAGAFFSDIMIYALARHHRDAPRVRGAVDHPRIAGLVRRLSRNLVVFALVFRFIPGMRTVGPVSLAVLGFGPVRYVACAAASSVLWGIAGVMLGYFLGHTVELIFGELERIEHALILPALLAAAGAAGVLFWRRGTARATSDRR
jgi:membrane protein DedA with SNARE-associated domain